MYTWLHLQTSGARAQWSISNNHGLYNQTASILVAPADTSPATKMEASAQCGSLARIHFGGIRLKQLRSTRHRTLINVLVAARQEAGLTQRQLAARLKRSNSFVWKIEAGERQVNVLEFIEIAKLLNVSASALIARVERP